jgi:septum formation protein
MTYLILASSSPRRKSILRAAGIKFRIDPSHVSEDSKQTQPRRLVVELARRKACAVASRHPLKPVLGADTIVVCAGEILGKPKDVQTHYACCAYNPDVGNVFTREQHSSSEKKFLRTVP